MRIYVARPGDSLCSIAQHAGIPAWELARINDIPYPTDPAAGQALVIPDGSVPSASIEICACAHPGIGMHRLSDALPQLSYLCPFSWHMDGSGGLIPIDDTAMIAKAAENCCVPLLTVSNIGPHGGFSSTAAHEVFASEHICAMLAQNILSAVRQRGCGGAMLDIQYIRPGDREGYRAFLTHLSELLHKNGYILLIAIPPADGDRQHGLLYSAHDPELIGRLCDRALLLSYGWGYAYSPPRAVSPVDRMRRTIEYTAAKIPPEKILLGFSSCGYDWTLPIKHDRAADMISPGSAAALASAVCAEVKFDRTAQAPYFNYTDPQGLRHEVWFEDARSFSARSALVGEYGLAGISLCSVNPQSRTALAVIGSRYMTEKIM